MIYEIYKEGKQASIDGLLSSENPYSQGSEKYLNWLEGWQAVKNSQTVSLDDFFKLNSGVNYE